MEKISLYMHIPFCRHKCDYCDFLSFVPSAPEAIKNYMHYLKKELTLYDDLLKDRKIQTIFLGGGTPSMVPSRELVDLLDFIKENYNLDEKAEITMEANPESLVSCDLETLKKSGLNRLSIGAQSASEEMLKRVGRIHSVEDIERAFQYARASGIDNINLDFISSLPGETLEIARENVKLIEKLSPDHVSIYSLILEDETPLHKKLLRGEIALPSEDIDRERVHFYENVMKDLGYHQYEISNFAREGSECLHNKVYWTLGEYLGLGMGAHSHVDKRRYWNVRSFNEYESSLNRGELPVDDVEILRDQDRRNEFMMLGIRMNCGIDLRKKVIGSNLPVLDYYQDAIEKNLERDNIEIIEHHMILTQKGRDLSNQVELDFFE